MKKTSICILIALGLVFSFQGCSTKEVPIIKEPSKRDIHTKSYQLNITPIIGSRQNDTKVIMDMGKVMKVWIAPYKNKGTFVSSHDNYVVAKAPDFVLGETVPQKNWKSMKTPTNNIPFLFRDADLDRLDRDTPLNQEDIVNYNNNVYKQQNAKTISSERKEKLSIYDKEIKKFLNK